MSVSANNRLLNRRNLFILFLAQVLGYINAPLLVFMLPLIGARLVEHAALVTLPSGMLIIGLALFVPTANMLMRRRGRKAGYLLGGTVSMFAGAAGSYAVVQESFVLLCGAAFVAGMSAAFVHSYRFAAVENAPADYTGRAVALILLGGVLGGSLGAPLANWLHDGIAGAPFAASWLALSVTGSIAFVCFCFYQSGVEISDAAAKSIPAASVASATADDSAAVAGGWWKDARLWAFAICGGSAYGMMTLLMTATPLAMHEHHGYSLADTAHVIQSHVIAMFLPSLFSGRLIDRFGAAPVMAAGFLAFTATVAVAFVGDSVGHYFVSLILLGIGWNFLFVGATTLTARYFTGAIRFRVQALNDVIVFSMQALAGLLSGALLALLGWRDLNLWTLAVLCVLALVVMYLLKGGQFRINLPADKRL